MPSRMQNIQEKKSKQQAFFFIFLTILLIFGVIFFGIPSLIKMAIFLSNLRSSNQNIEAKDTVAPAPARFQPVVEATNSAILNLSGFAEAGATVKLYRNGQELKEIIVDQNGYFTISKIDLKLGDNKLEAKTIDPSGNESKTSPSVNIVYDNTPPVLEVTDPHEGAEFFGEDREILAAGKTEPGIKLNINSFFVLVDTEGNFVKKLTLNEGENEILITASDKAGNTAQKSLTVNYSP